MDILLDAAPVSVNSSAGLENSSAVRETESGEEIVKADQTEVKQSNYDTVSLSNEARQYLAKTKDTVSDAGELSSEMVTETASQESDELTSSDLYSYTESELKDLLTNGDITRTEYNTEIARRNAGTAVSG